MSMIILNPTTGSSISNVQIEGKKYFLDKPFEIDTMIKLEDDGVAEELLKLYEFLVFMTPEDAKSYKDEQSKRKYECGECGTKLTTQQSLDNHTSKHVEDKKLEKELGIEVIKVEEEKEEEKELNPQDVIDQEARSQGLDYGEGIRVGV